MQNIRILLCGVKAQDKGDSRSHMVCMTPNVYAVC